MSPVDFKEDAFGRWIIVHSIDPQMAWTGSSWAPIDEYGLPCGLTQVSNFESREEAEEFARKQIG